MNPILGDNRIFSKLAEAQASLEPRCTLDGATSHENPWHVITLPSGDTVTVRHWNLST
jgi:hypothetical protein